MPFLRTLALTVGLAFTAALLTPTLALAQPKPAPVAAFSADALVSVNGLVCDFCAKAIEHNFTRQSAVSAVRIDLTAKLVSIDFKPSATMDDAEITRIVTASGFAVTSIRRTAGAP